MAAPSLAECPKERSLALFNSAYQLGKTETSSLGAKMGIIEGDHAGSEPEKYHSWMVP